MLKYLSCHPLLYSFIIKSRCVNSALKFSLLNQRGAEGQPCPGTEGVLEKLLEVPAQAPRAWREPWMDGRSPISKLTTSLLLCLIWLMVGVPQNTEFHGLMQLGYMWELPSSSPARGEFYTVFIVITSDHRGPERSVQLRFQAQVSLLVVWRKAGSE